VIDDLHICPSLQAVILSAAKDPRISSFEAPSFPTQVSNQNRHQRKVLRPGPHIRGNDINSPSTGCGYRDIDDLYIVCRIEPKASSARGFLSSRTSGLLKKSTEIFSKVGKF
jgi:hypothetical protein